MADNVSISSNVIQLKENRKTMLRMAIRVTVGINTAVQVALFGYDMSEVPAKYFNSTLTAEPINHFSEHDEKNQHSWNSSTPPILTMTIAALVSDIDLTHTTPVPTVMSDLSQTEAAAVLITLSVFILLVFFAVATLYFMATIKSMNIRVPLKCISLAKIALAIQIFLGAVAVASTIILLVTRPDRRNVETICLGCYDLISTILTAVLVILFIKNLKLPVQPVPATSVPAPPPLLPVLVVDPVVVPESEKEKEKATSSKKKKRRSSHSHRHKRSSRSKKRKSSSESSEDHHDDVEVK